MRHLYTEECGPRCVALASLAPSNVAGPGVWWLHKIQVPRGFRSRGIGAALLGRVLEDADYEGITIRLDVCPEGGLAAADLTAWYERLGFVQQPDGYFERAANVSC